MTEKSNSTVSFNNNQTIRILSLGEMMPIGSCSYRIRHTEAKNLAALGHSVSFVTPHCERRCFPSKGESTKRFQIFFSPGWAPTALRRGGFSLLDMLYKLCLVLLLDYDVLHVTCGHRPAQLIPALAARFFKRRPTIDEWWEWYGEGGRSDVRNKGIMQNLIVVYDRLFELKAKAWFTSIIVISSKLKLRLCNSHHVKVLHGGVEVDHLTPGDKCTARNALGLQDDLFVIGLSSVGLADHNDLLPFFVAFRELAEKDSSLRLFVTGEEVYVQEQFIDQPGGSQILYKGWLELDEYSLYMRSCDVFVLPLFDVPRNAGRWPHKMGDFLYFERPIISNPTGDLPELFANKRLGYLCENAPDVYCRLLEKLRGMSEDDLKQECVDSRQTAEALSSDRRVDSLVGIYKSVCRI